MSEPRSGSRDYGGTFEAFDQGADLYHRQEVVALDNLLNDTTQ